MLELTAEDVLTSRNFRRAVKTTPTKIRPITEADIATLGPSFLDLEKRVQRVEVGRYLCIGVQGERWTCGESSIEERKAVSEPDIEGFRLYVQRNPVAILVTLVDAPFELVLPSGDRWQSSAGAITWNGKHGVDLIMRVVEATIFQQTYQLIS